MPIHNPEKFTWLTHRPKTTSCGLVIDGYSQEKIDTLKDDARGNDVSAMAVTCERCRRQMKRGWFLRWLFS
jgi:hypothetical protein